eukprot:CAMPEP_0113528950 /NCGR_PEP_ID=MMETSP0015_2-20120614/2125_1 /TAXON_ID=2838 /ORGANISM="Odontella" /LENGTH=464 /DNA_ID=CAMNT_0000427531 /DNA_START=63 /DNA_END=1457 /DNA_ORIENTATION=- /assembly_acc=CAM_ASM_000160
MAPESGPLASSRVVATVITVAIVLVAMENYCRPVAAFQTACTPSLVGSAQRFYTERRAYRSPVPLPSTALRSSFYGDFESFNDGDDDDDEEDEDDDDDEYSELDEAAVAKFRSNMGNLFDDEEDDEDDEEEDDEAGDGFESEAAEGAGGISSVDDLISFATSKAGAEAPTTDWAESIDLGGGGDVSALRGGVVLLANPSKFCSDFLFVDDEDDEKEKRRSIGFNPFGAQPSPALLAKFGLTLPPPADLGPDRRADLLPVLVLLERHPLRGCQAVLMNRRTGYLLGDLEQQQAQESMEGGEVPDPPKLGAFMIQPLWFGGTSAGGGDGRGGESSSEDKSGGAANGLDMLHLCPAVPGASQLTEDGLYWGGDPAGAQDAMQDPGLDRVMTGFDFKFFVQSTRWLPQQLEKEINDGTWYVASVSKEILFKSRDRLGTKRAKPLWTEVMELMGGKYKKVRDRLYDAEG